MKYILILSCALFLSGCNMFPKDYVIVTQDGILWRHIHSLEECQLMIKKFKIDGLCLIN